MAKDMTCPKCCGQMIRKERINLRVGGLDPARFECKCGYTIDEATGRGYWPDQNPKEE